MRAEDPEGVEHGAAAIEWGSDAVAELLRRLGLRYISLVPGSSYRGLHDSLVNYNGNRDPLRRGGLIQAQAQDPAAASGCRTPPTWDGSSPLRSAAGRRPGCWTAITPNGPPSAST